MNSNPADPQDNAPAPKPVDFTQAVMQGGVWIFFARWSIRGIGIISTIVLARLLAPEDFGLMTICVLLVGLAQTIGEEGQDLAVIRRQNLDRDYMDSAWTAAILTGVTLGLAVFVMAPVIADYFNEPRAVLLIRILCIRLFLMGFYNIGIALNRRDFIFAKDFAYNVLEKVFPAVLTLLLAYYLRNYWALVIGSIGGYIATIIASYALHPYRPRLSFRHIREVWSFSGWVVLQKFTSFLSLRIDRFFVPNVGNTALLGQYHVGAELARMPVGELFMPLDRVLEPAYASLLHSPKELAKAFLNTLSVAVIICLPAGVGFALIAHDAVSLIYGEKWLPMIPVVEIIALSSIAAALIFTITPILNILGRTRMAAALISLPAIFLWAGLLLWQTHLETIADIAWARLLASILSFPIALICVQIIMSISAAEIFRIFWRPFIAVILMALVLLLLLPPDMDMPLALRLILRMAAGGGVYAGVVMGAWLISGKPPGAERAITRLILGRLGRT